MPEQTNHVSVRMSDELLELVDERAEELDIDRSKLIRQYCHQHATADQ
jgi:metal-responsive CopG/Arc/MetJ family transcriptional regulator